MFFDSAFLQRILFVTSDSELPTLRIFEMSFVEAFYDKKFEDQTQKYDFEGLFLGRKFENWFSRKSLNKMCFEVLNWII